MFLKESFIYINDLRFHAFHGVMPQERLTGNDYSVSIRIGCNVEKAMLSDDIDDIFLQGQSIGQPEHFSAHTARHMLAREVSSGRRIRSDMFFIT